MIDAYMNQSLAWKSVTSINEYNEPVYTTTTIKGRKETGHKLIRNNQGQEVISSARVFTKSVISNNDLIDGQQVISVESAVGLDGTVKFYTVHLL